MPNCVVTNCSNRSSVKSKRQEEMEEHMNITFHRFPKAEDRRIQWANAVGFKLTNQFKNAYICSLHFEEESFDRTSLVCVRLRTHAIPCINKADVSESTEDYSLSRTNKTATENNVFPQKIVANSDGISLSYNGTQKRRPKSEQECGINISKRRCVTTVFNESNVLATPLTSDISTQTPTYLNIGTTPEPTDGRKTAGSLISKCQTPRETLLRKAMQNQNERSRKVIQALKKQNRRQTMKIAELQSTLSDLKAKNLSVDEQYEILKTIGMKNMR